MEFAATPQGFTVKQGTVTAGPSHATVSATIENFSNPVVQAKYDVVLDGDQAAQILNEPTIPSGSVLLSGGLHYQESANQSALQSLAIDGSLSSAGFAMNTSTARTRIANLWAHYSLADGNASLENLRANVLGGVLTADGTMQAIGGNSRSRVRINLHNVSLAELEQAMGRSRSAKFVSVSGTADATATAAWGKTIGDLIARADLTLSGNAARSSSGKIRESAAANTARTQAVPIQGAFHAVYSNATAAWRSITVILKVRN